MNPQPGDEIRVLGENTVVQVREVVRLEGVEPYVRGYAVERGGILGPFRAIAEHRWLPISKARTSSTRTEPEVSEPQECLEVSNEPQAQHEAPEVAVVLQGEGPTGWTLASVGPDSLGR